MIALVGATGVVGGLVALELERRGHDYLAVGPDRERLEAVTGATANVAAEPRPLADDGVEGLVAASAGADVIVCAAPLNRLGRVELVIAAGRAGVPVVDLCPSPRAWIRAQHALREHGLNVPVVCGAGQRGAVGDALGRLAADTVSDPATVHVAYTLLDRAGMWWGIPSPGARQELVADLHRPFPVREHGVATDEHPAEARRLAWFPRPIGPSHAVGVPGLEALSLGAALADTATIRTYEAMPGWRAEVVQMAAGLTRWRPAAGWLRGRLAGRRPEPSPRRRGLMRWAVVAETEGREGVARAWANGSDPLALTAATAVLTAERLQATGGDGRSPGHQAPTEVGGPAPGRVWTPADLLGAAGFLDALAARTSLRWSIVRPAGQPGRS